MKRIWIVMLGICLLGPGLALASMTIPKGKVVNVTTAGTRVALGTTELYSQMTVCAKHANSGSIYIGGSDVLAASTNGTLLLADDCKDYVAPLGSGGALGNHYIDSTVNGEGVTVEYVNAT